ncbi:HNH endonuclease family protein [Nocardioides sp. LMS-CY]|uniref:HNH endonuclease family protein n=1 Tax=Nocardioides sp. (strain LMS-CY) TaxID=2840457 RepID=UPI001C003982|nr:HNH endonuclease family protein [Nocardioides sp. LMS-CY]QWF23797.1 HNH endonuclease family protein [Nocardioides sp. LMS-CY]
MLSLDPPISACCATPQIGGSRLSRAAGAWLLASVAGVALLAGCAVTEGATSPAGPASVETLSPTAATRALDRLEVGPRSPAGPAYDRAAFGTPWADTDGNGCNQRDDVLLRDAVPGTVTVAQQGRCDHDVLAGSWLDPYTGRRLTFDDLKAPAQAQAIQIDHVVPLAEAWRSGASSWSDARRREYANDLAVLLAVDGPANAAKSDDDPAAWRPRRAYQCEYAVRWVAVKSAWSLTADRSEVAALRELLGAC